MSAPKRSHTEANPNEPVPPNKRQNRESAAMTPNANGVHEIDPDGDLILHTPGYSIETDERSDASDTTFLVSSKHLKLASPWFKASLSDCWSRGQTSTHGGKAKMAINDCKPDILHILLTIIHGLFRKLPRQISFQQLAGLSRAADFYQCTEMVEPLVFQWLNETNMRQEINKELSNDLPEWIMVACIFKFDDLLSRFTKMAAETSTGPFRAPHLPIPTSIKNGITQSRQLWLNQVLCLLEFRIFNLLWGKACESVCDASYLRHILRILAQHKVFFRMTPHDTALSTRPIATTAFLSGLKVTEIRQMITTITEYPLSRGHRNPCSKPTTCPNKTLFWGLGTLTCAQTSCESTKMSE